MHCSEHWLKKEKALLAPAPSPPIFASPPQAFLASYIRILVDGPMPLVLASTADRLRQMAMWVMAVVAGKIGGVSQWKLKDLQQGYLYPVVHHIWVSTNG